MKANPLIALAIPSIAIGEKGGDMVLAAHA